ncbi:MAG: hypothetical protein WCR76_07770 [Sphaerochaetaceae bacterium]
MTKVCQNDVLRVLYLYDCGKTDHAINREKFGCTMLSKDLIVDPVTIRTKWKQLINSNYVDVIDERSGLYKLDMNAIKIRLIAARMLPRSALTDETERGREGERCVSLDDSSIQSDGGRSA